MLNEVRNLPDTVNKLQFIQPDEHDLEMKTEEDEFVFEEHLRKFGAGDAAETAGMQPHDPLSFGGGLGRTAVLSWWILGMSNLTSKISLSCNGRTQNKQTYKLSRGHALHLKDGV